MGAMVLKEVQERAPTRRVALLRSVYVLALYGAGLVVFLSGTAGSSALGKIGREIFVSLSYLQFFLAAALSPALTANSITKEKTSGTLGILFLSGLRSSDIILGKLGPRLVDLATAILASLPLVLVYLLFGGVTTTEYVQVYLVMIAVALFSSTAGLFFSVLLRNGSSAIILSYGVTAAYLFFPQILPSIGSLRDLSPIYCLDQLLDPTAMGRRVAYSPLLFAAAMSVVFVWLAITCLQRFAEADLGGHIRTLFEKLDPIVNTLMPKKGIFFQSEGRKYINPFTWRELNAKPLAKFRYLFIMMLLYALVLLIADIVYWKELTTRTPPPGQASVPSPTYGFPAPAATASTFPEGYVFIQIGVLVLIATVLAAGTIAAERESHALDVLLTTPMFPQSYVYGKFLGLFWGCMLFIVPLSVHVLMAAAGGWLSWIAALSVIVLTPAILACNIAHGLYVSLTSKSTVRAVIVAIVVNSLIAISLRIPVTCFVLVPIDPIRILHYVLFESQDQLATMQSGGVLATALLGVPIFGFIIFCANAFYVTAVLGNMVDNFQKRARSHLE